MAMQTPLATRSSGLPLIIGLVLGALVFALVDRGLDGGRGQAEAEYRSALVSELEAVSRSLPTVMEATDSRIRGADHFRLWLDERGTASSSQLMDILRLFRTMPQIESAPLLMRARYDEAALGALGSLELQSAVWRHVRLQEEVAGNPTDWLTPVLDRELSPGAWRHVFEREEEALPVDFRETGRLLSEAGFIGEIRRALRELEEHQARLEELGQVNEALLQELRTEP